MSEGKKPDTPESIAIDLKLLRPSIKGAQQDYLNNAIHLLETYDAGKQHDILGQLSLAAPVGDIDLATKINTIRATVLKNLPGISFREESPLPL